MPNTLSTSNRMFFLSLKEYGEDDLLIEEMQGNEALSELFEFRLKLLSYQDDIDPEKIIGKSAILRIETWDTHHSGGQRHWNGFVSRFACTGRAVSSTDAGLDIYTYACDIVPWFWFMTQNEDCRIFQNLSVPDIIETIFDEFGYSDYKLEFNKQYNPLEYCTQYNESSFAFISRLIEREGIYYYFRHNEDHEARHILVFTDNKDSNPKLDPFEVPFHHAGHAEDSDAIRTLSSNQQMRTRKATLADFDYKKKTALSENTPTMLNIGSDIDLEHYHYPGNFVNQSGESSIDDGKHLSTILMEAQESSHLRFTGESQVRELAPGHRFKLYDHIFPEFDNEYLVLSVQHTGRNNLLAGSGEAYYGNQFSLQPNERVYRAPVRHPTGYVRGPQTALVVGPPGNEIYTDELGRIKIRFHWDRKIPGRRTNMADDKASCWVRVAQMWAGNGYGTLFTPRIGMEVVVDFLEGNPDRPLVVGCVYNGVNTPPLKLPDESTCSTIKTLSSKGGGGFNELRFEDKKGEEEIFLHAQKDFQQRIGHCKTEAIGNTSNLTVGKTRTEYIGENAYLDVEEHHISSVGINRAATIGEEDYLTVGTHQYTDVGANMAMTTGMNFDLNAGLNALLTAGVNIEVNAGVNMAVEAGAIISLKAGGSSITLTPGGIFITGPMVMINSGGSPLPTQKAQKAEKADPTKKALDAKKGDFGKVTNPAQQVQAQALRKAAKSGQPFCAQCEAARKALEALRAA